MEFSRKIIIADDEIGMRDILSYILSSEYDVKAVSSGSEAVSEAAKGEYDILFLDLSMQDMTGIEVMTAISDRKIKINTVIVSASNDVSMAVSAMKMGAYDYITKPVDAERIRHVASNIFEKISLEREVAVLREKVNDGMKFSSIISVSNAMKNVFSLLMKVINTDITILITGESGTGKGILADAIHFSSNRLKFPFRSLDCSTIPRELIESELFGYEKGAFTGAGARKSGKFELAGKGTLFLDEISNISFDVQAKLLKVLQEKQFERVGGGELVSMDARIIAATNRDLRALVSDGKFREDLYYRLNVFPVNIPPLRERIDDIPVLINYFLTKFNLEYGKDVCLRDEALDKLINHIWPGNVRELENTIRRTVLIGSDKSITASEISGFITGMNDNAQEQLVIEAAPVSFLSTAKYTGTLDEIEKAVIIESLGKNGFNISKTAGTLGISRKTLHNKLKTYGITLEKRISAF